MSDIPDPLTAIRSEVADLRKHVFWLRVGLWSVLVWCITQRLLH
jgi:hypothetical protein